MRLGIRSIRRVSNPYRPVRFHLTRRLGRRIPQRAWSIYGPESSGKTTIALHAIAQAQKNGGAAAFVDAEHAMDASYAKMLESTRMSCSYRNPTAGTGARNCRGVVRSGALDILVIDPSPPWCLRRNSKEMGDSLRLQARLMSQALRKLTAIVSKSNTCMIFINQIRRRSASCSATRDHYRRARAEVLLFNPGRHPEDRVDKGRRRGCREQDTSRS